MVLCIGFLMRILCTYYQSYREYYFHLKHLDKVWFSFHHLNMVYSIIKFLKGRDLIKCWFLYSSKSLRKSSNPSTTILPMRTPFAGPFWKSFRSCFPRHPRYRAKVQAPKKSLDLFSPDPQKIVVFHYFSTFPRHQIRPYNSYACTHLYPYGLICILDIKNWLLDCYNQFYSTIFIRVDG